MLMIIISYDNNGDYDHSHENCSEAKENKQYSRPYLTPIAPGDAHVKISCQVYNFQDWLQNVT